LYNDAVPAAPAAPRSKRPPRARRARPAVRPFPRLPVAVWWIVTAALLVLVMIGIERKITWYLAVDQYGYLAFAHDLASGHVFHHWPPLDALAPGLPRRADVLSQTYVWDDGRLYCRYAPGFPIVLAAWLDVFGDDGANYLNPTIFLAILLLALAFQARVFHSRWRATAGLALVALFPTFIHLWALTLTRDLATHLAGLLGLYLLLPVRGRRLAPGRVGAASLAIGFAGSIRPDAVMYGGPALLLIVARWWRERPDARRTLVGLAAGTAGLLLGLAPFLAFNRAATGSAFRPTQGMEADQFLGPANAGGGPRPTTPLPAPPAPAPQEPRVGYPPGAWQGGTAFTVQGGGLRLANIPQTLPGIIGLLRGYYGDVILGLAIWGAVVAFLLRRMLFLAAVPYCVIAVLFFSCWSRPDTRYMVGLYLFLPMLVIEGTLGTLDLVRRFQRTGRGTLATRLAVVIGVILIGGVTFLHPTAAGGALPVLSVLVPGIGAVAVMATTVWPSRRHAALAAPGLALALVVLAAWRTSQAGDQRASFQGPQMRRARATFGRAVERGAVVITTEDVGRPGENIDYYVPGVHALYLTDLARWRLGLSRAAELLIAGGLKPYLFIPASQFGGEQMLAELREHFSVELAADVPPPQAIEYFVAAAFHRGVRMLLYRVGPKPG
jgi:hypothetical protein